MKNDLQERVDWVWRETINIHRNAPETRIASSLSPIEIFVSLFYGGILEFFPKEPLSKIRDRLIISKGHGSICMYPILADLGFFDRSELLKICKAGGILGGIPDPIIPGYETVNGSLGHGLGVATGSAIALKTKQVPNSVFVVCGDGELHEGSCWEAIMFAAHHNLDNLNVIIDDNSISMLGHTDSIISHKSLAKKFHAFGWDVYNTNGHDIHETCSILECAKRSRKLKPKVVIAKTLKGKGVPGLENQPLCHIMNPSKETLSKILDN